MIVVADTSPINYLIQIEQIEILPRLFGQILIPPFVWKELQDSATPSMVRTWLLESPAWLERKSLLNQPEPSLDFLDPGEREAITLAIELRADHLIADESLARAEATRRRIRVIGTLGALRNAARANLLSLPESLSRLQQTNFYVDPRLIESLLEEDAVRNRAI